MTYFDISFLARSTSANPEAIRTRAEELDTLQSRLLGRADDLDADFNHTASQFTDLMAWNIRDLSAEELQLWRDAGTAIAYASSMVEMWAQSVEEFEEERSAQMSEWWEFLRTKRAEIPDKYQGQTITATYPEREGFGWLGDENKCRSVYDEVAAKAEDLKERERTNYQAFENHAEDVGDKLRQGPTKENVQALIDAGINSWAFYNLDPNHYTMLVDNQELTEENAEEWSEELEGYWSGHQPIDARYHELMLMMSMITTNAMQAQQGGTGYRNEELDFLRAFYDELEEDPNPESMGVIGIPAKMEGDHLSEEEREHALGVLGDGLLALSDERVGGGYDELPASVRSVVDGPDFSGVRAGGQYNQTHTDWMERAGYLDDLLSNSHEDFEGGAEFSTRMMDTVSASLVRIDALGGDDSSMSGLLDVATRNEDANYAVLTGDYPEGVEGDLPWTEETADNVTDRIIGQLYTHEWGDDGEAARGLTEWIEDMSWSDDEDERRMAAGAMDGLMETITSKEMHDTLSGTGIEVELSDGTKVPNAPFTAVNGEVADGFAHLFEVYIESFADEEGLDGGHVDFGWERGEEKQWEEERWDDDSRMLAMSPSERLIFLEYVMGNEDSAVRAHTAAAVYSAAQTELYLESGNKSETGANAGVLQSLVDAALHNEAVNRNLDLEQEQAMRKKLVEGVANSGNNALGLVPGVGVVLQSGGQFIAPELINEAFNDYVSVMSHEDSMTTAIDIDYHTSARVLAEVIERGGGELPVIDGDIRIEDAGGITPQEVLERAGLLDERDGGYYIDFEGEPGEDAPSSSEVQEALNRFLDSSEVDWTPGETHSGTVFSSGFTGYFSDYYDPIQDQMRYTKDNIAGLYEGVPANAPSS
ncbi:TPR repeat region-containing protein [Nocardiopsis alborubida]|uniref:TPR repeat domain-containing protein n=1 Tax=Nocardiopsis alborubida TaxID=146802 RepID=A0A7X6MEX7_9ACTN|nr:hypothetical protein [Nocardiopsis alborubida]NKZ00012.1 hypothetical protein [Nocardiopsis alborubida]